MAASSPALAAPSAARTALVRKGFVGQDVHDPPITTGGDHRLRGVFQRLIELMSDTCAGRGTE